ncbi:unknown [Clostridium sp. CAG:149]|nr:unknown [Clostridium sp. CAG:149]
MVMIAVIWFALVWMMLRFFTALVTPGKVEKEYEDREQEQFLAELSRRMES